MNKEKIKKKFDNKWIEIFLKNHESNEFNTSHICPVLRMIMLRIFLYEILYDVKEKDHIKMNEIRNILDDVLLVNQNIIRATKNHRNTNKSIFPEYFDNINIEIKNDCMEKIEFYLKKSNYKFSYYDIRPLYARIIKILETTKLNRNNLFDRLIEHCEYGIYLGFLLKIETDNIEEKNLFPNENELNVLKKTQKKFRYGMEVRAKKLEEHFNKKIPKDSYVI